jgi:hypothetical protein
MYIPFNAMKITTHESVYLQRILSDLKAVIERENKRHQMDEHLTSSMRSLLEDEIIPQLENELDWEPSDADLGVTSEPPMTMDEMHKRAYEEKRMAWS